MRAYAGDQGDEPLGREPTPERHIERTVQWAREVYRVLRDDGVFFCNYGDCYHGSGGENGNLGLGMDTSEAHGLYRHNPRENKGNVAEHETPRKMRGGNLALMPHRIALALQADGWIVRQDLVWAKPNPMPESVAGWRFEAKPCDCDANGKDGPKGSGRDAQGLRTAGRMGHGAGWRNADGPDQDCPKCHGSGRVDEPILRRGSWRHTRAHEYVFQLTKGMGYFSDQEAVRELAEYGRREQPLQTWDRLGPDARHVAGTTRGANPTAGRNPRSVLHIPTAPYRGAHYATFPPALIAPLILATCPRWCCPVCGQGWAPVIERAPIGETQKMTDGWDTGDGAHGSIHRDGRERGETDIPVMASTILGHRPTCDHPHTQTEAMPGIVVDPFVGSGTTVMVAQQLLRRGIGFDLSMEYLDLQATLRTGIGSPSNQLDNLPLFGEAPRKANS